MSKGLSQVLGLIIAGVVFMTLALTMVALITGFIPSFTDDVDHEACLNNLEINCQSGVDRIPQSCIEDGEIAVNAPQFNLQEGEAVETAEFVCP